MASAYSDDLRAKFYAAYQRGDGSVAVLAGRFGVSQAWGEGLLRDVRRTGSTQRPPAGPRGPRSKLTGGVRQQLGQWIGQQPDLTLREMQQRLLAERQLYSSQSRLWDVLQQLGLRLKKSRFTPPSKTPSKVRSGVASGASRRRKSTRKS
jgi:transposase